MNYFSHILCPTSTFFEKKSSSHKMGISGLLPFLKDALTNVNIREYEGSTVAVDTYCWIYKGAFSCAEDLALGNKADGYILNKI